MLTHTVRCEREGVTKALYACTQNSPKENDIRSRAIHTRRKHFPTSTHQVFLPINASLLSSLVYRCVPYPKGHSSVSPYQQAISVPHQSSIEAAACLHRQMRAASSPTHEHCPSNLLTRSQLHPHTQRYCFVGLLVTIALLNGRAPPPASPTAGVRSPAGVPTPLNGLTAPLGGTGIPGPSGLPGTKRSGRPSIGIRLALLL